MDVMEEVLMVNFIFIAELLFECQNGILVVLCIVIMTTETMGIHYV